MCVQKRIFTWSFCCYFHIKVKGTPQTISRWDWISGEICPSIYSYGKFMTLHHPLLALAMPHSVCVCYYCVVSHTSPTHAHHIMYLVHTIKHTLVYTTHPSIHTSIVTYIVRMYTLCVNIKRETKRNHNQCSCYSAGVMYGGAVRCGNSSNLSAPSYANYILWEGVFRWLIEYSTVLFSFFFLFLLE